MWRHIPGVKQPEKRKLTSDEKLERNREYDKAKRVRTFQTWWKTDFPWVMHDTQNGVMYCKDCRAKPSRADITSALYKGSSNFQRDTLVKHSG